MRTVITILCLGVLVADMGFCGCNRRLTPQQRAKFDADAKAADDGLSAVEVTLKRFEEAPAEVAFPDLAALDEKFGEAENSVRVAHNDNSERDPDAQQRYNDLDVRRRNLDERLTAVYRERLSKEQLARLDAAMKVAEGLYVCDNNLKCVEHTPPGQDQVAEFRLQDRYVTTDVRTALRDVGEELAKAEQALAAARDFIDGPSREHVRAKQRKKLEAAITRCADCAKRLDAARKARGVE